MSKIEIPKEYLSHLARQGFMLEDRIGGGLSGDVYIATQKSLGRNVAVKFFDSAFVQNDEVLRKRFVREARILVKLQHPNIPYVITRGLVEKNGQKIPYIVMQYIEGETLDSMIRSRGSIAQKECIIYIQQVLGILSFVHSKNILHRDIKPSNIMVLDSGHCYLIDFSIGVSLDAVAGMTRVTRTGEHLGSMAYMSPEQSSDMNSMDARSDLYSLGVVLLELLTGSTDKSNLNLQLSKYPVVLREAVKKACAHQRVDRFENATDFSRSLNSSLGNIPHYHGKPSKACCSNLKCPNSQWSPQGYFKGPNIIEECTDSFCTSCGKELIYQCKGCGAEFEDKPFCGNCGGRLFTVPECETCGSFLKSIDMYTDTKKNGCEKCRSKRKAQAQPPLGFDEFDDDIPF